MIESIFQGNTYRFHKNSRGNYWTGVSGSGGMFPGANCIAPLCIFGELQKIAVAAGHCRSNFIREEKEKTPKKRSRTAKKNPNSISIF
jgi:hypothetical protein